MNLQRLTAVMLAGASFGFACMAAAHLISGSPSATPAAALAGGLLFGLFLAREGRRDP